jgi:hypothetical protein
MPIERTPIWSPCCSMNASMWFNIASSALKAHAPLCRGLGVERYGLFSDTVGARRVSIRTSILISAAPSVLCRGCGRVVTEVLTRIYRGPKHFIFTNQPSGPASLALLIKVQRMPCLAWRSSVIVMRSCLPWVDSENPAEVRHPVNPTAVRSAATRTSRLLKHYS